MKNKVASHQDLGNNENIEEERGMVAADRHFGNVLPICWREDNQPKYVLGPHYGLFLCTLLLSSLLFFWMAFSTISSTKGRKLQITLSLILSFLFYIYTYLKVGFSNPGLASSWNHLPQSQHTNLRYCVPCRIIRPIRTVHCYSCDICIYEYDHHCPWVGKCIGRDNLTMFKMFVFGAFQIMAVLALCLYVANSYEIQKNSRGNNIVK